jgi:hypothetical protein
MSVRPRGDIDADLRMGFGEAWEEGRGEEGTRSVYVRKERGDRGGFFTSFLVSCHTSRSSGCRVVCTGG